MKEPFKVYMEEKAGTHPYKLVLAFDSAELREGYYKQAMHEYDLIQLILRAKKLHP